MCLYAFVPIFRAILVQLMRQILYTHWPGILLLLIATGIGMGIYQDFGISIDEGSQREIGQVAYQYAKGAYPDFHNYKLRDHGPGFEWVYIFFEKTFNITSFRDIFLMRHLVTYLFFVTSMFAGYVLIFRVFGNRWLATFGLAALIFHPVIFGHAFFNPKDIPAMCMFLVAMATTQWAFSKQQVIPFFILGLVCGYGTTIRLMNIIILAPIALFLLMDIISAIQQKKSATHLVAAGLLVCAGTCITLYTCWPTLWERPLEGLQFVYETSAKYPWKGDVRFAGQLVSSTELPWSYIPTWLFITTPELFLLLGIIGLALCIAGIVRQPMLYYHNTPMRTMLLAFICFLFPMVVVIKLDAVLYDGWRHMYFIYPAFVMLMIYGLNELLKYRQKIVVWSLCILQLVIMGRFMVKNHPFGHVYFNSFVPHTENYLAEHYELDYWGTSHKHGLEWLAEHDKRYGIKVFMDIWTLKDNYMFLNDPMQKKFILTWDIFEAEYFLEFFRTTPYQFPNKDAPESRIIYEKKVSGSSIYRIVKLR